jgi:hypothetical protein
MGARQVGCLAPPLTMATNDEALGEPPQPTLSLFGRTYTTPSTISYGSRSRGRDQ